MKRHLIYRLTASVLGFCLLTTSVAMAAPLTLGLCIYNGADTFMHSVSQVIEAQANADVNVLVCDSLNDQNRQFDQVRELLEQPVDALILNAVDRTAAVYLVRIAKEKDVPLVFINREPLAEDLALYDSAYYVGTDPKETGRLCGQLVADWFSDHPEADKNDDGIIQYVLLKGEQGHQDAEFRTTYSVRAITEAGFPVERLAEESAMWERALGQEKMAGLLSAWGDQIECVISNNDDMALGAIDALKAAGWFANDLYLPVVGVDATEPALDAVREGSMLGTVLNDATNLGVASFQLALLLANRTQPTADNFTYRMDEQRRVYINSHTITAGTLSSQ